MVSSKMMNVRVTTMDAELEFGIQSATTGKQLFDQVVKTVGLREVWFFGLLFVDSKNDLSWIKLYKKITSQDVKKENPMKFKFRAKFYPEDAQEEIIQVTTLRMFYLQVKDAILSDEIYCPPETSVLLASYAVQVKHGEIDETMHTTDFLKNERLLPQRVFEQYNLNSEQWGMKIIQWWKEHKNMPREDAMMEYLKIAQDLEMYGVNYFEIKNKKGTELYLGVDALGLNIYQRDDKLTPKIGFPWSEIKNISFQDRKFMIKPIDKKSPDFVFFSPRVKMNKMILALCMGNHELYMRRRKPDTIDVQQMKMQAKEEKSAIRQQREKLKSEIAAREEAERKQLDYENRIKAMKEEMEQSQKRLLEAQNLIRDLQEQLKQLETVKKDLEYKQLELRNMMSKLEEDKNLETLERQKLEEEIEAKKKEVEDIEKKVEIKDLETKRLQVEIDAAKIKEAEYKVQETNNTQSYLEENHDDEDNDIHCEMNGNHDLAIDESIIDPIESGSALTVHNDKLSEQLKKLQEELQSSRIVNRDTAMDKIHQLNVVEGKDKYKTLREIRKGNTKRRVDQFENL